MSDKIDINKRHYNKSLTSTVVVICLDGSQKEYIDIASSKGLTPNLDKILENGLSCLSTSVEPNDLFMFFKEIVPIYFYSSKLK